MSKGTLLRLFYLWRRTGKTPDAFRLCYRSGREKLNQKQLIKFLRACFRPGTHSYRMAHRQTKNTPVTVSAYRHSLPGSCRQTLARLFSQRRRLRWTERQAQRVLADFST